MGQYILLLHEAPADFTELSAEDLQGIIAEYTAWRDGLVADGTLVASNKLADEGGRSLTLQDGTVRVVDGPYAEAKEVIGGYFVVQADDYEAAVGIARECPHLGYGGRIELRAVDLDH